MKLHNQPVHDDEKMKKTKKRMSVLYTSGLEPLKESEGMGVQGSLWRSYWSIMRFATWHSQSTCMYIYIYIYTYIHTYGTQPSSNRNLVPRLLSPSRSWSVLSSIHLTHVPRRQTRPSKSKRMSCRARPHGSGGRLASDSTWTASHWEPQ